MEVINFDVLNEHIYYEEMNNGLKVYLLPKEGFSKTYALFSTRFGSADSSFIPLGEKEMITVPDGIAHFLEHKMFETKNGDVMDQFAALGANTNAFTSCSKTAYLFNTTSHEEECLELLLDFVQDIYLTDQTVEKEKGIINQEIGMGDDDPDWRCYFGSIQNLYQQHPVRKDIAGTVETVNEITKDILEKCYHTFYHPSQMVLFVVGNIEPQTTMELIRKNQDKKTFTKNHIVTRKQYQEPKEIMHKETIIPMDVTIPKIIISTKINDILSDPLKRIKRELAMGIFLDMLFSKSSSFFEEWTQLGIINDSFSAYVTQERDYSFLQIGGDTMSPDILKEKIFDLFLHLPDYVLDEKVFKRIQKKTMGIFIESFNSPEGIANLLSHYYFEDIMAFELIQYLSELTLADIEALKPLFQLDYTSACIIMPKENR